MDMSMLLLLLVQVLYVSAHGDSGKFECQYPYSSPGSLLAAYQPGIITVDGAASDWSNVQGQDFPMYPALDPDGGEPYPGKMTIKVAHDGRDLFFLLEIPGDYQHKLDDDHSSPSLALMFGVGDNATYHSMGGCSERLNCSAVTCGGHEVDIMHFSISKAIPGRLYGSNLIDNLNGTGKDSIGNLNDLYGWNPHCLYNDGDGPDGVKGGAQNDWRGAWSHTSVRNEFGLTLVNSPYASPASPGSYTFEFARPLRTSDRLQQDVQLTIGHRHRFGAAFWYPMKNTPWSSSQHFSANCEWIPLTIQSGIFKLSSSTVWTTSLSTFSLLFAMSSLLVSLALGLWIRSRDKLSFTPISNN